MFDGIGLSRLFLEGNFNLGLKQLNNVLLNFNHAVMRYNVKQ